MLFLQDSNLLQSLKFGHGTSPVSADSIESRRLGQKSPRSSSPLAHLVQIVRHPIQNVGRAVEDWYEGSTKEERTRQQSRENEKQLLYLKLREATKYDDWQATASQLDGIEGNNSWKSVCESPDYDAALVEARLKQLDEARISCDVGRMLFLVRTSLTRGLGDMGNLKLYKHSHIGTKDLIERYINSALQTLDALLDISAKAKCDGLETKYILEQVLLTRQAFGRSALLLSGGATFGMSHIGVIKALWEARLLPRIISGSSAGSIVCAVCCTRTDEEMPALMKNFCLGDLAVFEEEGNEDGLLRKFARFLKFGALFDISHLTRVMKDILGDMTFQEAYNRTRRILNICVSSASLYELPRLLNYITAPNVLIWSAVAASCSVPLVFSAASLLAKDSTTGEALPWNPSPQRWIDGSVDNDLPMTRLAELFNVNHFIVSQVNPHVVPFLIKEEDSIAQEAQQSATDASTSTWLHRITHLAKGEALHRMHTMAEMGIFSNTLTKAVSVLSQKYSGDITIFPEISYADFPRMLSNPTTEFMLRTQLSGERATWPKLSRIKNHCAIELALDNTVHKLRARVAFSPSQVDLRLSNQTRSNSNIRKGKVQARNRQRPFSQNNAPDHGALFRLRQVRDERTRDSKFEAGKKPLTFHPVFYEPSYLSPLVATAPLPLEISTNFQDVVSSGAETSDLARSLSSSSRSSSPMESASPSSPFSSQIDHHHLFPSVSQPVTPCLPTSFPPNQPHQPPYISSGASSKLAMTPKTPTETAPMSSSPESHYKRLFHHRPPSPQNLLEQRGKGPRRAGDSMRRNWALNIDIPGAKDIISRKKKEISG